MINSLNDPRQDVPIARAVWGSYSHAVSSRRLERINQHRSPLMPSLISIAHRAGAIGHRFSCLPCRLLVATSSCRGIRQHPWWHYLAQRRETWYAQSNPGKLSNVTSNRFPQTCVVEVGTHRLLSANGCKNSGCRRPLQRLTPRLLAVVLNLVL